MPLPAGSAFSDDFSGYDAAAALETLAARAAASLDASSARHRVGGLGSAAEADLAEAQMAVVVPRAVRVAVAAAARARGAGGAAEMIGRAQGSHGHAWDFDRPLSSQAGEGGEGAGEETEPWRQALSAELRLMQALALEERARYDALTAVLPLSTLAAEGGFTPPPPPPPPPSNVSRPMERAKAEYAAHAAHGKARLGQLGDAITAYVAAARRCRAVLVAACFDDLTVLHTHMVARHPRRRP